MADRRAFEPLQKKRERAGFNRPDGTYPVTTYAECLIEVEEMAQRLYPPKEIISIFLWRFGS